MSLLCGDVPERLGTVLRFNVMNSLLLILLPILLLVALIDWATMSPERRAKLFKASGYSQQRISKSMGISRYRVRQYLAA